MTNIGPRKLTTVTTEYQLPLWSLPMMIFGDHHDLTDDQVDLIDNFVASVDEYASKTYGRVGHWDINTNDHEFYFAQNNSLESAPGKVVNVSYNVDTYIHPLHLIRE